LTLTKLWPAVTITDGEIKNPLQYPIGTCLAVSLKSTTTPIYGVESEWKLPVIPYAVLVNRAKEAMIGRTAIMIALVVFKFLSAQVKLTVLS